MEVIHEEAKPGERRQAGEVKGTKFRLQFEELVLNPRGRMASGEEALPLGKAAIHGMPSFASSTNAINPITSQFGTATRVTSYVHFAI